MAGVMIGIDPHKGSHTAVALDASEKRLGQVRVRAPMRRSTTAGSGRAVAGTDLGDRGRARTGSSARPAAARRRRAGRRRATQARRAGAAAQHRPGEQERPERRPLGRGRRAALARRSSRWWPRITRGAASCGRAATAIWAAPGIGSSAGCTRCSATWCPAGSRKEISAAQAIQVLAEHHRCDADRLPLGSSSLTSCSTTCTRIDEQRRAGQDGASPASSPRPKTTAHRALRRRPGRRRHRARLRRRHSPLRQP